MTIYADRVKPDDDVLWLLDASANDDLPADALQGRRVITEDAVRAYLGNPGVTGPARALTQRLAAPASVRQPAITGAAASARNSVAAINVTFARPPHAAWRAADTTRDDATQAARPEAAAAAR